MPFADAADRRVAGHLPEGFDIVGEQQRLRAHAGGSQRSFRTGVAAADDDDVVGFGVSDGGHWGVSFGFQAALVIIKRQPENKKSFSI